MKQTAVEIVENKVEAEAIALLDGELTFNEFMDNISKYFNQAKEMEKNQIKSAFTQGDLFAEDYFNPEKPNIDCSEQYYNETFKSE
jgi:hypothetical protein